MSIVLHRTISLQELRLEENNSQENLDRYISRLDLTNHLFHCAAFNQIASNRVYKSFTKSQIFISTALNMSDEVRQRSQSLLLEYQDLMLLARPQLLHLMRAIAYSASDIIPGSTSSERQNDLLLAALKADYLANADWVHAATISNPTINDIDNTRNRLPALRVLSQYGVTSTNQYHALGRLKVLLLDKMFSKKEFSTLFQYKAQMSIEDFFYGAMAVLVVGLKRNDQQHPKPLPSTYFNFSAEQLYREAPHMKDSFQRFLYGFSMTSQHFKQFLKSQEGYSPGDYSLFKILRERPIFKSHKETYVIADADMFLNAIEVGPLFKLMQGGQDAQYIFGCFGLAFEQYCQELVSRREDNLITYGTNAYVANNAKISNTHLNMNREIDISLTYNEVIIPIECKAVWLKDEYLCRDKHKKFWKHVNKKFGVTINTETGEEDRKGVGQLADIVKLLSHKESMLDNSKVKPEILKKIIPVLLVHDALLNAPTFGELLAREFGLLLGQENLSPTGYFIYNGIVVHNLILLTIDEIELLVSMESSDSFLNHLERFSADSVKHPFKNFADYLIEVGTSIPSKHPLASPSQFLMEAMKKASFPSKSIEIN